MGNSRPSSEARSLSRMSCGKFLTAVHQRFSRARRHRAQPLQRQCAHMDIARPDQSKAKRRKRIIFGSIAVLVLAGITVVLAKLKPAAPTVEANLLYPDTV